ncbi:MAG: hypothetical protein PHF25_07950 [Candidatus Margulisbacteria bacterium]|nr:hypothetical protein [Candidatus Margulisiibacteriota bacterium]
MRKKKVKSKKTKIYSIFQKPNKMSLVRFAILYRNRGGSCDNKEIARLRRLVLGIEATVGSVKYFALPVLIGGSIVGYPVLSVVISVLLTFAGGISRLAVLLHSRLTHPDAKFHPVIYLMTLVPFNVGFMYTMLALNIPGQDPSVLKEMRDITYKVLWSLHRSALKNKLKPEEVRILFNNILRLSWDIMKYQNSHFSVKGDEQRKHFMVLSASLEKKQRKKATKYLNSGKRVILIDSTNRILRFSKYLRRKCGTEILKRIYYYDFYQMFPDFSEATENKGNQYIRHMFDKEGELDSTLHKYEQ